jgi:translation elongation factor EF-Tu-like GTPase
MAGPGWMVNSLSVLPSLPCTSHSGCPAHAARPPHVGCQGMLVTAALPQCVLLVQSSALSLCKQTRRHVQVTITQGTNLIVKYYECGMHNTC